MSGFRRAVTALCFLGNILTNSSASRMQRQSLHLLRSSNKYASVLPSLRALHQTSSWKIGDSEAADARHAWVRKAEHTNVCEHFRIPRVTPQMPLGIANFGILKRI